MAAAYVACFTAAIPTKETARILLPTTYRGVHSFLTARSFLFKVHPDRVPLYDHQQARTVRQPDADQDRVVQRVVLQESRHRAGLRLLPGKEIADQITLEPARVVAVLVLHFPERFCRYCLLRLSRVLGWGRDRPRLSRISGAGCGQRSPTITSSAALPPNLPPSCASSPSWLSSRSWSSSGSVVASPRAWSIILQPFCESH